jgi:hypothetical protein
MIRICRRLEQMIFIRWFLQIRCTCSMLHYQPIRTLAYQSNLNAKALRRWVAKFSTANNETLRRFCDDYGYEKMVSAPNKKQQCSFFPFEKRFSPRCGLSTNDTQCNYRLKSAFFRAVDFFRVTYHGVWCFACVDAGSSIPPNLFQQV